MEATNDIWVRATRFLVRAKRPRASHNIYAVIIFEALGIKANSGWRYSIALEACDRCKRREQRPSGQVSQTLSAVLDHGLRAYPLRDMPELPGRRGTGSSYHFRSVSMKLGSGSSSSNEDASRYQPFTQYCLRRENGSRTSGYTCTRRLCTAQTYGHTTHTWVGYLGGISKLLHMPL